jgi:hypothetical protein
MSNVNALNSQESLMNKKCGYYLGTEIDEKWWKRYFKEGFFAQGRGEYWYDDIDFFFIRYLTSEPIEISFDKMSDLKVGAWHCGKWIFGYPIIKILWYHQGQLLSSGFAPSNKNEEVESFVNEISQRISPTLARCSNLKQSIGKGQEQC